MTVWSVQSSSLFRFGAVKSHLWAAYIYYQQEAAEATASASFCYTFDEAFSVVSPQLYLAQLESNVGATCHRDQGTKGAVQPVPLLLVVCYVKKCQNRRKLEFVLLSSSSVYSRYLSIKRLTGMLTKTFPSTATRTLSPQQKLRRAQVLLMIYISIFSGLSVFIWVSMLV